MMVPLVQYQKAVLKGRAYRAEAHRLAVQLRRTTTKAARLKSVSSSAP